MMRIRLIIPANSCTGSCTLHSLSYSNSCSRLFCSKLSIKLINDVLYIEIVHLTEELQHVKSAARGELCGS